jgi:class 3 adenylate cyclase/tetratricopeptide (TPR) repeat protein/ABC-type transport system involved in cytochrome c biogenesis ATPase subunit
LVPKLGECKLQDIQSWLTALGLEKYLSAFVDAEVDFSDLAALTEDDLKEIGLPVGPRRRASDAIKAMGDSGASVPVQPANDSVGAANAPEPLVPISEAERRHLTVMFVDLVGSTEMVNRFDPEDVRNVITGYQNTVAGVVARYDGFIAQFLGDGVLCYFGWPRANEDDAERAVRAGLDIIASVRKNTRLGGVALASRVGIASGVVVIGDMIGSAASQEKSAIGETPNLAARLQGLAQSDGIVLAKETRNLLGNSFVLRSLGKQTLKGIGEPVEAFAVVAEAAQESRFDARQEGTLTPIVGRDREIELMLERWTLALAGQGQMVIVSGEAGIGKSRITKAVIDAIAQGDHTRITYQCSPYHADSAFYPVIQQITFAAGILPADGPDARLDKLEALLGAEPSTLKLIAPLMGLDGTARYGALDLTPAQQRARTMQTLAALLVQQAAMKPVLLVYEDLHWVDPTSLELLDMLLDTVSDQRIMILATARPTFEYGFGGHPIVTRFALNRLGKDQIGAIVSKLTDGKALPDEIMEIIASRTDGVPLFVEELTKTILESGALKDDGDRLVLNGPLSTVAIPATLHDSLMARLDRLQPIKEVAQTAACIGRAFSHGLLAQISPLPEAALTTALDGLIKAELIYRRGLPPEATYLFKHALVRDAAYESLLKERRRVVHTRILSALESDPDIAPEVRAVHAEAANLTDRAIDLWEAASKAAIALPAFDEAISHLGRAIALITPQLENSDPPPFERALALQVPLGMTLLSRKGYTADETLEAFEKALVLADKIGETPMRHSIQYGLWLGAGVRGRHVDALRTAEALVEETANAPNTPPMVVANRSAGYSHWFMGNFAEAQRYLDVALANFDPIAHAGLANQFGQDIGTTVHNFQAFNLLMLGQTRRAATHIEEAESLAMSTGHILTICTTLGQRSGWYSRLSGDRSDAERCTNKLASIAQEHNLAQWMGVVLISTELLAAHKGDKSSIARYRKIEAALTATKYKMGIAEWRVDLGRSALAMGLREEAVELAMMAQEMIDETGETYALSDLHRLQASIAIAGDDTETAEKYLVTALDVARQQGAKLWELRAAIDLASLLHEQGRNEEAISVLDPIHKSIAEGDCPEDQATARALLAELAG